ncbi:hypothetical protein PIB30_061272 [Stylosanthes scabra]|uniref:Uncharacterized protein n=1 Tax=Stylosanthes scabra TaxID=79078 RepID=A0ABU6TKJ6_9FABA|nr:hypothetical protein [Stylosanthes scabra]
MVTISDFNEDNHNDTRTKPLSSSFQSPSSSSSSFSPTFDPSNPAAFLHKVFDFVSHESDFFGIDAAKKEITSLTRATRDKRKKAKELKAAAVAKHEAKKKLEKRLKQEEQRFNTDTKKQKSAAAMSSLPNLKILLYLLAFSS